MRQEEDEDVSGESEKKKQGVGIGGRDLVVLCAGGHRTQKM